MDYVMCLLAAGLAAMLVASGLIVSRLVAPRKPGKVKHQPFECGEETIGRTWIQFNVGFYLFGLLFLIFDVEAAFLFPWAVVLRQFGVAGLIEVGVFVFILIVGLVYAWKKGALEWV